MGSGKNLKDKTVWIELLRIIACFFVIVNHTNSQIFANTVPSPTWFVSLTYFFVSKIAVPLFVMISGYLLLDREETYGKAYKRVACMLIVLTVFSLFYYIWLYREERLLTIGIRDFLEMLFTGQIVDSYWYLYMYIGLLGMLPFLQKLVKGMQQKDFHVFFLWSFVIYGIWPILVHYASMFSWTEDFEMPLFTSYICMLFIGAYLKRYGKPSKKWKCISVAVVVVMLIFNVTATYCEYLFVTQHVSIYLFLDDRTLFPIVISAAAVFYLIKDMRLEGWLGNVITIIGSCTFGMYLLSDYLVESLWYVFQNLCWYVHPFIAVIALEIVVFVVGFVVTCLLKKIPFLKALL